MIGGELGVAEAGGDSGSDDEDSPQGDGADKEGYAVPCRAQDPDAAGTDRHALAAR